MSVFRSPLRGGVLRFSVAGWRCRAGYRLPVGAAGDAVDLGGTKLGIQFFDFPQFLVLRADEMADVGSLLWRDLAVHLIFICLVLKLMTNVKVGVSMKTKAPRELPLPHDLRSLPERFPQTKGTFTRVEHPATVDQIGLAHR